PRTDDVRGRRGGTGSVVGAGRKTRLGSVSSRGGPPCAGTRIRRNAQQILSPCPRRLLPYRLRRYVGGGEHDRSEYGRDGGDLVRRRVFLHFEVGFGRVPAVHGSHFLVFVHECPPPVSSSAFAITFVFTTECSRAFWPAAPSVYCAALAAPARRASGSR